MLPEVAARSGDAVYATFNGVPIHFDELHRQSDSVAVELRNMGVHAGDRVALMLRNSPESLSALFGIAKSGAVWVPVNIQAKGDSLKYLIEHSSPKVIIANEDILPNLQECGADLSQTIIVTDIGERSIRKLAEGGHVFSEALPEPDALFALNYTSGTTGRPKGVQVTHRMLRYACEAVILCADAYDDDIFFVWEPLYHIGGAQLIALPLLRRIKLAMVDRFSASRFWEQVNEAKATHIHYLGGVLQILLKQPVTEAELQHKVRVAWGGGCPKEIWRAFEERFRLPLRECYGMTESSSITTYNGDGVLGSVGRPVPWLAVKICDDNGVEQPVGTSGEIIITEREHGAVFKGYFNNVEATQKALQPYGFRTGDLGALDADGYLNFLGRLTDSVRVRGENVSAFEVEHVASSHPDVEDCAIVGVKADIGEQEIKLFIQRRIDSAPQPADISSWLASRLANFQNPRYIAFVDSFERTPSQRIMKHRLSPSLEGVWDRTKN